MSRKISKKTWRGGNAGLDLARFVSTHSLCLCLVATLFAKAFHPKIHLRFSGLGISGYLFPGEGPSVYLHLLQEAQVQSPEPEKLSHLLQVGADVTGTRR